MKAYCRKYTVFRTFTWYFIKTIKTWQPFETLFTKMSSSEQSETSVPKIKNSKPSLILQETRMHSSRMRNVRCKGHRGGCLLSGVSVQGLSVQGGVYPSMHRAGGVYPSMHSGRCVSQHALGAGDTHPPL